MMAKYRMVQVLEGVRNLNADCVGNNTKPAPGGGVEAIQQPTACLSSYHYRTGNALRHRVRCRQESVHKALLLLTAKQVYVSGVCAVWIQRCFEATLR